MDGRESGMIGGKTKDSLSDASRTNWQFMVEVVNLVSRVSANERL